jgi:hypothetical protein
MARGSFPWTDIFPDDERFFLPWGGVYPDGETSSPAE